MAAGAVGGYFGGRLAAAGHEVPFIARGAHRDAIHREGLQIESALGDLHLQHVDVTDDPRQVGPPRVPTRGTGFPVRPVVYTKPRATLRQWRRGRADRRPSAAAAAYGGDIPVAGLAQPTVDGCDNLTHAGNPSLQSQGSAEVVAAASGNRPMPPRDNGPPGSTAGHP
jgi:hypothetical protein